MSVYSNSDSAEVVLIVVHSVLVIVNIAGNSLVCVIILRNRDMRYADKKNRCLILERKCDGFSLGQTKLTVYTGVRIKRVTYCTLFFMYFLSSYNILSMLYPTGLHSTILFLIWLLLISQQPYFYHQSTYFPTSSHTQKEQQAPRSALRWLVESLDGSAPPLEYFVWLL